MAEKSKGLAGNSVPGIGLALLCPVCDSPEDVSDLGIVFSAEADFSSKEYKIYMRLP